MGRALITDLYELNMAASYLRRGMTGPATFSLFTRDLPRGRGFLVAAGLADCLDYLESFAFTSEDLDWLRGAGFGEDTVRRLGRLRFTGDVHAVPEGRVVLPGEPLLEVTAPVAEAQLVETFLLNQVTFQTAIATKATRCRLAAPGIELVDFALRRTHGVDAGMAVARVSAIAGFAATSNVEAARRYGLQAAGTMAHSYIEAFRDEADAFRAFAQERGVHDAHWSVTHTAIAPTLRKLGAWHDLAVIERDMVDETRIFDILGEAMLCSRVPCLVLPPAWSDRLSFQRIVIGWNGSFESTRALHSALPLLQLAGQVTLVNGQARASRTREPDVAEPDPIAYLRQHGVAARAHDLDVPNDEVGKALLHTAHERRADLLVMGGYGRSRIRERVLGGATRHVMAHAGIPVFMQH
jgi:nucleotide-binding universal stress UspA family protein